MLTANAAGFERTGVDRANRIIMRHGTEVEVLKADTQPDGTIAVELKGMRCFQLVGDPWLQEPEGVDDPAPAPLETIATTIQGASKFIVGRVEYALDPDAVEQQQSSTATEELSKESQEMLDDIVGEADKEANRQQSHGVLQTSMSERCTFVSQRSHGFCVRLKMCMRLARCVPTK